MWRFRTGVICRSVCLHCFVIFKCGNHFGKCIRNRRNERRHNIDVVRRRLTPLKTLQSRPNNIMGLVRPSANVRCKWSIPDNCLTNAFITARRGIMAPTELSVRHRHSPVGDMQLKLNWPTSERWQNLYPALA